MEGRALQWFGAWFKGMQIVNSILFSHLPLLQSLLEATCLHWYPAGREADQWEWQEAAGLSAKVVEEDKLVRRSMLSRIQTTWDFTLSSSRVPWPHWGGLNKYVAGMSEQYCLSVCLTLTHTHTHTDRQVFFNVYVYRFRLVLVASQNVSFPEPLSPHSSFQPKERDYPIYYHAVFRKAPNNSLIV